MRLKFIPPLMPTLVEKPPEGDGLDSRSQVRWLPLSDREGCRGRAHLHQPRTGLDSRNIATSPHAAGELEVESTVIDGEIIVLNAAGLSDFGELRKAITRRQHDLYFVAFDLLHLNGHDLRDMPLEDRREILAAMMPEGGRIQFSQALPGEAKAIFHLVDQAGLEGMVSKRWTANIEAALDQLAKGEGYASRIRSRRRARTGQASFCPDGRARHRPLCRLSASSP